MIAQAAYAIGTIAQSSEQVLKGITQGVSNASNYVSSLLYYNPKSVTSSNSSSSNLTDAFQAKISNELGDDPTFLQGSFLQPYKGLYLTQPTKWIYYLPFFQSKYQSTDNSWRSDSSTSGGSLIQGISEMTQAAAALVGKFETVMKAGSFQEKTKFFQFSQDGDSITISFPLINTGSATFDDVVNNWQFIFQLIYQNRPERVDRNIVNPPMLYEVTIPGVRYIPYAYISNIDIEYKGSRRSMDIQVPMDAYFADEDEHSTEMVSFNTIIPEAYQVTLTITGLVADSRNFMYSVVTNPNLIKVT